MERAGVVPHDLFSSDNKVNLHQAAATLAALGHKLRLELWKLLLPHGSEGLSAGRIAAHLVVAPSSLSFHLQQMTQAGILLQRRSSRHIIYAVNNKVVAALCAFLSNPPEELMVVPSLPSPALSMEQSGDIVSEG